MENLQKALAAFVQEREWESFHNPKNLAMALAVEVAELMEPFRWLDPEDSRQLPEAKMAEVRAEVGDVMICLANFCRQFQLDPIQCAFDKLQEAAAKYPADKVRGQSKKYNEY